MYMSTLFNDSPAHSRPLAWLRQVKKGLCALAPLGDLMLRIWVARVFWLSGLTKIESFDSTLQLFRYEYSVPLLPPDVAAYLATFSELVFSVLLTLGLFGRFSAAALFLLNLVAVISYPDLDANAIGYHKLWGLMLLMPLLHGPGKLSVDFFIAKKFGL
ncbi:MAG: DoxX family protein [Gammaproteobacteria bacterium]